MAQANTHLSLLIAISHDKSRPGGYYAPMDKVMRKFSSHRQSAEADRKYYLSLTPPERLAVQLELIARAQTYGLEQGFARVHRVVKLHRR